MALAGDAPAVQWVNRTVFARITQKLPNDGGSTEGSGMEGKGSTGCRHFSDWPPPPAAVQGNSWHKTCNRRALPWFSARVATARPLRSMARAIYAGEGWKIRAGVVLSKHPARPRTISPAFALRG